MPLRDVLLTLVVVGLLPVCLARPWIGLLTWFWLGFMNPHRLTWGFAYNLPFAMMVAAATLPGVLFAKDRKPFLWTRETVLLCALWGWFGVTTLTALYRSDAVEQMARVSKILLMTLLVVPFFQERQRIRMLLLVVAGSIGLYGFKGGIWVLLTGGYHRVYGAPGETFISSNNAIALALNMCLPLFFYLAKEEPRRWLRWLLFAVFFASIVAVPFTYSRGGFLGLLIVLAVMFLNRKNLLYLTLAAALLAALVFGFAPTKWFDRVDTIANYEEDSSANARLTAWSVAFQLAVDRPVTGGGFWGVANVDTFNRYAPGYRHGGGSHDAHSIYFNLLGEHGFVGLGLWGFFVASVLLSLHHVMRRARGRNDLRWAYDYAFMLRSSIIAYLATGTFLSVAYFDLAYLLLILVVPLKALVDRALELENDPGAVSPQPATSTGPALAKRAVRRPGQQRRIRWEPGR